MTHEQKTLDLLRSKKFGILSTHSADMPGFPFGSLTAYALDDRNCPIFLMSSLAQHTKNILKDPKVSLTVIDMKEDDIQNAPRVTVLGETARISLSEKKALEKIYFDIFPGSKNYRALPDFYFFRLSPKRIRYIGGLGEMSWIEMNSHS